MNWYKFSQFSRRFYHGTSAIFPFQNFNKTFIGSGLVTRGINHGGMYFTSTYDNALFYTQYFVIEVNINNLFNYNLGSTHPPTVMKRATVQNKNYIIEDVIDGAFSSDIAVVPSSNLGDIQIKSWKFIGDKISYFQSIDNFIGIRDLDNFIETIQMIDVNYNYIKNIPIINQYILGLNK